MIEIRNTGGDVRAVLVGDPEQPDNVKLLQPGESFTTNAANVTVNDGANVRDRRASDQAPFGRRTGDPRVDQRQVRRSDATSAARTGANYGQGPQVNAAGTIDPTASGPNSNDPRSGFEGVSGTKSTPTSDGSNVPKDASGQHLST